VQQEEKNIYKSIEDDDKGR